MDHDSPQAKAHEYACQPSGERAQRPLSVSKRLGRLQFHHSGKFRVLQLADLQDGPIVAKDTIRLIEAAVTASRPDIVIFSGNQIAGYDTAYAATYRKRRWESTTPAHPSGSEQRRAAADLAHTRDLVRGCIGQFVRPLAEAGVPWAVTYGNHDFQCGLSNEQLDELYREHEGCLNTQFPVRAAGRGQLLLEQSCDGLPDQQVIVQESAGTFALPVTDVDGKRTVLSLVLLDSGDYARAGGYGEPSSQALRFLQALPSWLDDGARSIVFQHTPLPQFYRLLKPVPQNAAHAVEGYRRFSGQYYALDDEACEPGGYLGEGVSCPDRDSGEFAILTSSGAYFALSAGHDHRNAFGGDVDGVRLFATPTCGFGSYGPVPGKRAARLFEFDIRHPYEPRTQLLEFGELVGKPSSKKAYVYGMTASSKPESEGVDLLHKPGRWSRLVNRMIKR